MELLKEKLKGFNLKNKKLILPIVGIIGILLIGLSSFGDEEQASATIDQKQSDTEYCNELEQKIKSLVSAITGDTGYILAITLESSGEYIYANQNTVDTDQSEDTGGGSTTTRQTHKSEQKYIIVEGENGEQSALVVTEKKPDVRGVAIVTAGLNDINYEDVLSSVSSMLGIASRKINISQKAE